uniref:Uncharacterized protein n=1 Tax=Rhodnius prolixus TaxID=13249 RepID=T1HII3_RHOPR
MFLAVVLRPSSILVLCEYRKKEAILREVGGVIRLRKRRNCRFQTKTDRFAKKFLLKLNFKVFPVKQEITLFSKGQFRYNQLSLREKIEVYYKYVRHVACLKRAAAVSLQKASGAWNGHLTALSQRAET